MKPWTDAPSTAEKMTLRYSRRAMIRSSLYMLKPRTNTQAQLVRSQVVRSLQVAHRVIDHVFELPLATKQLQ